MVAPPFLALFTWLVWTYSSSQSDIIWIHYYYLSNVKWCQNFLHLDGKKIKTLTKGSLISESFSLWLKSPKNGCQITTLSNGHDLAPISRDLVCKSETRYLSRDDCIKEFIKRIWSSGLFWVVGAAEKRNSQLP